MIALLLASLLFAPADDELARGLFPVSRAVAERGLAPRSLRVATGPRLSLATAVRMVAGVHRRAADLGALAQPATAARLAAGLVLVLDVTDLADGRLAADVDPTQLAARHADDRVVTFLGEQLCAGAGRPDELSAATEGQLDVVHCRADRDVGQRDRVADPHCRFRTAFDGVADLQAERRQDVALFAVLVVNQGDARAAVGVVLDGRHLPGHAVLVALEVDLAVQLPVAAALVAGRDPALVVAPRVRRQRLEKRLLRAAGRDLVEARDRHEATAGA